ncbi:MAG TPA: hypothetical protein VFS83_08655 [Ktedonobacterales bacterium]|nr:hypothetical protein [Ktedonobacterales bacterium]
MGTLNPETVDALNMLLEDLRASVEIEVALSNGATEYLEREALSQMGVEDSLIAFLLHDWLDMLNLPVTRRINGIVLQALDLTRYDDRLQLFVHHQLASCDQARQLLEDGEVDRMEGDGQAILRALGDAHTRHAAWCEERAREFAETRLLDFRRPPYNPQDHPSGGAESDPLPDISGEHSSPRRAAPVMVEPSMENGMDSGMEETVGERESPPVE